MMQIYYDDDADLSVLDGRKVAIPALIDGRTRPSAT